MCPLQNICRTFRCLKCYSLYKVLQPRDINAYNALRRLSESIFWQGVSDICNIYCWFEFATDVFKSAPDQAKAAQIKCHAVLEAEVLIASIHFNLSKLAKSSSTNESSSIYSMEYKRSSWTIIKLWKDMNILQLKELLRCATPITVLHRSVWRLELSVIENQRNITFIIVETILHSFVWIFKEWNDLTTRPAIILLLTSRQSSLKDNLMWHSCSKVVLHRFKLLFINGQALKVDSYIWIDITHGWAQCIQD